MVVFPVLLVANFESTLTGRLVRAFFVLIPPQLCSLRLSVVLIKVLSSSEEHVVRRRSLRGRSEWVRGFVMPSLFLFILKPSLPPSPSFLFSSLLLPWSLLLWASYQKASSHHPLSHLCRSCFYLSVRLHCETSAVEFGVVVMPAMWVARMCQDSFA